MSAILVFAASATPFAMLVACFWRGPRERMLAYLALAPIPALAAALLASGSQPLALDLPQLQITLALDRPGAILLGAAALLWMASGVYASTSMRNTPNCGRFSVFWLLTLAGSVGVFITADLWSFFLTYALVSLSAYGLVMHDGTPRAHRAGGIYLTLAVLGEGFLLLAFVMLAIGAPEGKLLIRDVVAALPTSPWRGTALALLIAGFGLKCGLVPFHVWMPVTYQAAPMPAAAVLSGAASKAGVIGLMRFLPLDTALPDWGTALVFFGFVSAFYGVAIGITQRDPKTVLAYSSISQMGVIATVLGMGLVAGGGSAAMPVAFYAAHHVLVKGALFLAVGAIAAAGARRLWAVMVPAGIIALGLGGLPFTGGALAKLAVKDVLGSGVVALLSALSAAGTTFLMLHFLSRLSRTVRREAPTRSPEGLIVPWLAMAFAAIAVPWALYPTLGFGGLAGAFAPSELWSTLWPVLIGGGLALALQRRAKDLPAIPPGDVLVVGKPAALSIGRLGIKLERADGALRQWPVATLWVAALAIAFGAVIASGQ